MNCPDMNCAESSDQLVAYIESLLDEASVSRLESHLDGCPACRSELEQLRQLADRLSCDARAAADVSLENRVMDGIIQQQALELRRITMRKRYRLIGISGAVVAATMLFAWLGFWAPESDVRAKAAEVLAKGAAAVPNLRTIHIQCKMRTPPRDNFAAIRAESDFVPVELWKQFGAEAKWRIEKPGRVAVMDGQSTLMYIKGHSAIKVGPSPAAFDTGWFHRLASVDKIIAEELQSALAKGSDLKLSHETAADGAAKQVVTVEAKAGLGDADYLKNKFLTTSDNRRVFRFDAKTGRLEDLKIYIHEKDREVLILQVTRIDYDQPIDPSVFTLQIPEDISWHEPPQKLPDNEKYERMTPRQAARAFFEACAKEDWDEARKFHTRSIDDRLKNYLGGLEILQIGEPFQSGAYPGWFVPYQIKLKSGGYVKKHNLALKRSQAKRFFVDGGI